jgi:hypothetical protein
MKTILIIEDDSDIVRKMTIALAGLGTIVACTTGRGMKPMPVKEEVERMIAEANVILLDADLGSRNSYQGKDLFPFCAGKKVIGISTHFSFGEVNYCRKNLLTFGDSPENQKFRTLVSDQIQ